MNFHYNMEFDGIIRLSENGERLSLSENSTSSIFVHQGSGKWAKKLRCSDGRALLNVPKSERCEEMEALHQENVCRSTCEFVITNAGKVLLHLSPHSETMLHHPNHSKTNWPLENMPRIEYISYHEMVDMLYEEKKLKKCLADGYKCHENLTIRRNSKNAEYVDVNPGHRFTRREFWRCHEYGCDATKKQACHKEASLASRRGNFGYLVKPKGQKVKNVSIMMGMCLKWRKRGVA